MWRSRKGGGERSDYIEGVYNRMDSMKIQATWRDKFPKSRTGGGYIGDNYPLCIDLPSCPFLQKGAMYRFLGQPLARQITNAIPSNASSIFYVFDRRIDLDARCRHSHGGGGGGRVAVRTDEIAGVHRSVPVCSSAQFESDGSRGGSFDGEEKEEEEEEEVDDGGRWGKMEEGRKMRRRRTAVATKKQVIHPK